MTALAAATVLRIERRFDATPETVFDAWLDPRIAAGWLFTAGSSEAHAIGLDPRLGGQWITDRRLGRDYQARGEYLEIDRPRRIVFTFGMPQFSPEFCRVTVEIRRDGAGCVLELTQEPVPVGDQDGARRGWLEMFDTLAAAVG
jgi:uncharacterized protein YndB with AHSA1/START domain